MFLQGYAFVPEGDEEALKEAVYSRGPMAVSLDASHRSFRFYSHGKEFWLFPLPSLHKCIFQWRAEVLCRVTRLRLLVKLGMTGVCLRCVQGAGLRVEGG